jgi:chemotaxis protein methyltransferase CheR
VQRGLLISMLLRISSAPAMDGRSTSSCARGSISANSISRSDFRPLGFDAILQRVLLHFDVPTKRDILARLARALAPTASLPTGSAETVIGLSEAFVPHQEHPTLFVHRATQRQRPELMLVSN